MRNRIRHAAAHLISHPAFGQGQAFAEFLGIHDLEIFKRTRRAAHGDPPQSVNSDSLLPAWAFSLFLANPDSHRLREASGIPQCLWLRTAARCKPDGDSCKHGHTADTTATHARCSLSGIP